MRLPLLRPLVAALVPLLLVGALRADSSAHKPVPPTPNPDLVALKESIANLATGSIHELTDATSKNSTRLDAMDSEVRRIRVRLDGVDLAQLSRDQTAAKAAVGDLVSKSDALDQQLQELGTRLDGAAAEAARNERELKTVLGSSTAALAALTQDERQWHELFPKQLATQSQASARQQANEDTTRFAGEIAVGALALLIMGSAALQERRRRRGQRVLVQSIARLEAEFRQGLAAAAAARATAISTGWEAIEDRLAQFTRRWESLAALGEPIQNGAGTGRLADFSAFDRANQGPITARLNGSADHGATLSPSERATVSVGILPEPFIASRLLWPAEFLDPQSPLSRWRFLLESHFDDVDHPALPVLAGLLSLRAAAGRPAVTAPEIAAASFRLSEALYAYWQSLPDLSAEDRQQASAAWIRHVRQLIASIAPRVELREIMPGTRVDPDLMHATQERSGNHLNVAEVHSWAVVDRSGDRLKVFHRAQITST